MKQNRKKEILIVGAQTFCLVAIVLLSVFPLSCRITQEGVQVIGGDYSAPVLENMTVVNDTTVQMCFSEAVTISNVVVSPVLEDISDSDAHSETEDLSLALRAAGGANGKIDAQIKSSSDGKTISFCFAQSTQVGKKYEIFGVVHDAIGNSLTFCAPFTGYNNKIPKVIMTEVQIKYTKAELKTGTVYRSEFVEFLALTDGNLAGLELVGASDGENKKFSFPAAEVSKGQIFLVHLRTCGEGCVDESVSGNFGEATAEYSCDGILDFWSTNTAARFNDTADVIILRNNVDNTIMDALMYSADDCSEWKTAVAEFATLVEQSGIYDSEDISNSCSSSGSSPKKSLQRVDCGQIYQNVIAGEQIDLPISVTSSSWTVAEVTPGTVG